MFVTDDAQLYEAVLTLSNHGRARGQIKQFWPDEIGYKYKMSNIQAAIGCAQLERIEDLVSRKRAILARYRAAMEAVAVTKMNPQPAGTINGAWMPTVVFDAESDVTREKLQESFKKENIDARVFFHPLSSFPMFESCPQNLNAYDIPRRAINLPSYHDMTLDEQERVNAVLIDAAYGHDR